MPLLHLLAHLWTLPNTLLALGFGIGGTYTWDRAHRVVFVRGGWMVALFARRGYAGMSVGDVILGADDLPRRFPGVYRHELVHTRQARLLGPLYLPATFAGYALGWWRCRENPHDGSPLEVWADVASGNAHRNAFLRRRAASRS